MRGRRTAAGVLVLSFCLAVQPGMLSDVQAGQTAAAKAALKGLQKVNGKYCYYKNGKRIKNQWKTIGGKRYYLNSKGYAVTGSVKINGARCIFNGRGQQVTPAKDRVVSILGKVYCVSAGGTVVRGWHIVKNKLYYVCSTGLVRRNMTWQGITFSNSGAAVGNTACQLKKRCMTILASITNDGMTKGQKLQACWNYVTGRSFYYVSKWPNLSQPGWQKSTALNMLTTKGGNCYSFACAFAALAAEIGYQPKVICGRIDLVNSSRDNVGDGRTPHCWVMIDGCYFDPEAQFADWAPGIYGADSYPVEGAIVQKTVDFISD
ncbi:MAG: transglutaminase domain-containing protein [Candidatus Limivivens sp.]|nr:transglutaminase domain-containing protein [Candidatus Limivivens sp.]